MGDRVRIQPYISAELRQRLAAYAAATDATESGIAQEALAKYLDLDSSDEALVLRRLDSVVQRLERVEERLDVVGEAVARFVRVSFKVAPPQLPADAPARAEVAYQAFVATVCKVATGRTFVAAVHRARLASTAAAPVPATKDEQ